MNLNETLFFTIFMLPNLICIGYTILKDREEYKKFYKTK